MSELTKFKFVATLVLEFKKIGNNDETRHSNFYSNLKSETTIKESDIDNLFESIYITILSNIQKFIGKSLSWTIDSVIDHTIDISNTIRQLAAVMSNYQKNFTIQEKI